MMQPNSNSGQTPANNNALLAQNSFKDARVSNSGQTGANPAAYGNNAMQAAAESTGN